MSNLSFRAGNKHVKMDVKNCAYDSIVYCWFKDISQDK